MGQAGGYTLDNKTAEDKKELKTLEGVQCEACHGPGYQSCSAFTGAPPNKKSAQEWKAICLGCHTEKESLHFNFDHRFPKVLHGSASAVLTMSRADRLKLLQQQTRKSDLFDNPAAYVGAESCKKCHEQEYGQWAATQHAAVAARPEARGPSEKKYLFTTGAGSPGGGIPGVQCEACHGPGERHVKEPANKGQDYIVGLSGSCNNCVVEQICRTCHGPGDDPQFDFEAALEKIRHKPKQ